MTINNVIEEISNSFSSESFLSIIDKKSNFPIECNSSLIPIFTKILSLSVNKPIIYINNSEDHCIDILNWTKNLSTKTENIILFPEKKKISYKDSSNTERIKCIFQLQTKSKNTIIISTLKSIFQTVPSLDYFNSQTKSIKVGDLIKLNDFSLDLIKMGFTHTDYQVESPGEYTIRGGIIDIFCINEKYPMRIELYGDNIDSIREFDQHTQISLNEIKKTDIKSFNYDEESVVKNQGTILDHISQDCLILLDNPNSIFENFNENIKQLNNSNNIKQCINNLTTTEFKSYIYKFKTIEIFPWKTENSISIEKIFNIKNIPVLSNDSDNNQESKINLINNFQGQKFIQTSYINRTQELFNKIKQIQIIETPPYKSTPGFIYNSHKSSFILIGDKELYGTKYISTIDETRRKEIIINDEINPGDYIVHADHGIGKFINFGKPPKSNSLQDYMIIEYAKSDKLYVPLIQIQKISPYIAPTNKIPKLTTLGGESWTKAKQKAQESALKWARELLAIYAKRELSKGITYSDDNEWEKDLEGSFPFKETPDQTSAIELIKNKMQNKNPMDVLICGDVGFGKTEVAIRAAFKAVCNGKQVAIIAPTTILTQQHYETFSNRLSAFPVEIEYLSRFKSKSEQKVILNNIKNGSIDICIGTHRIIQNDVNFNNIGLLIIDEEQRFGVKQKEQLKSKYPNIDIITMTATPIPRTLYMAISGIKDLYSINTAPEQRLPVETIINEYDESLIQQSITDELNRGGQVFFLHNRVQSINIILNQLKKLIPNAKIKIAHGQMNENDLEKTMLSFAKREIDILCCTTIIESGLDLPNVNTLIVNNAHKFGLSQLYQLRGRVGRSIKQAYSYFLIPKSAILTPQSEKRLQALKESVELGSGYKIAMRDLELRGTGNILGKEQSGHVITIGLHLYSKLISEAKKHLTTDGNPILNNNTEHPLPILNMDIKYGLTNEYIKEDKMKFELYRQLSICDQIEDVDKVTNNITDRFGTMNQEAKNLILNTKIQILSANININSINKNKNDLIIRFHNQIGGAKNILLKSFNNAKLTRANEIKIKLHDINYWANEIFDVLKKIERIKNI